MVKKIVTQEDIKKIKVFNNIDNKTILKLTDIASISELKKGNVLYNESEKAPCIYAVLQGKLSLSKHSRWGQKITYFILGEGDLVNESIIDGGKSIATAEAYINTVLIEFKLTDFTNIMMKDFDLTKGIIKAMGRKQRRLARQLKNTMTMKIDKKLSVKLWKLARDHGIPDGEWIMLDMKMTITSLSYLMGASRETISRAMRVLNDEDLVKWESKRLFVRYKRLLDYYENE